MSVATYEEVRDILVAAGCVADETAVFTPDRGWWVLDDYGEGPQWWKYSERLGDGESVTLTPEDDALNIAEAIARGFADGPDYLTWTSKVLAATAPEASSVTWYDRISDALCDLGARRGETGVYLGGYWVIYPNGPNSYSGWTRGEGAWDAAGMAVNDVLRKLAKGYADEKDPAFDALKAWPGTPAPRRVDPEPEEAEPAPQPKVDEAPWSGRLVKSNDPPRITTMWLGTSYNGTLEVRDNKGLLVARFAGNFRECHEWAGRFTDAYSALRA